MALTIDSSTSPVDSGASAAAAIDTALQAQVAAAEVANVDAVLGSIGLGGTISTTA